MVGTGVGIGVGTGVAIGNGVGVGVGATVAWDEGMADLDGEVEGVGLVALTITPKLSKLPNPISSLRPIDILYPLDYGFIVHLMLMLV